MSDIALKFNNHSISAGDMSGNLDGGWIDMSNATGFCVFANWTGSPVGNIVVRVTNDDSHAAYKDISTTAAGGSSGTLLSNNADIHYKWVKVLFSFTSGTGSLDAWVSGKKSG